MITYTQDSCSLLPCTNPSPMNHPVSVTHGATPPLFSHRNTLVQPTYIPTCSQLTSAASRTSLHFTPRLHCCITSRNFPCLLRPISPISIRSTPASLASLHTHAPHSVHWKTLPPTQSAKKLPLSRLTSTDLPPARPPQPTSFTCLSLCLYVCRPFAQVWPACLHLFGVLELRLELRDQTPLFRCIFAW